MEVRFGWKRMLAGCLLAGSAACAAAQTAGDATVSRAAAEKQASEVARGGPARWHQEDVTAAQRMRTRQKEIGAALNEAKNACRLGPAAERPSCLKEAQANWKTEMEQLRTEAKAGAGAGAGTGS